jgi:hypothetical protein
MLLRQREIIEWVDDIPLAGNEQRFIEIGNVGSGETILRCDGVVYFTFGVKASHALTFNIQTCLRNSFGVLEDTFHSQAVPGVTFCSPYSIALFREGGRIVLPCAYLRLKLTDTSTAQHTKTHFYAKAWGE